MNAWSAADLDPSGSSGSAGLSGSYWEGPRTGRETGQRVLGRVRGWFERFVTVVDDADLDVLTLWAAHTHVAEQTYTTPRLILDSPIPGSGKTTVLEHLLRLCVDPVQAASLSSPALLARLLANGVRTLLIDEADRSLSKDNPLTTDFLAILNSGYKRGGTRPVLVPGKGGSWDVSEMSTYSPVAMAGNNPNLPDDTKSRSIRVLLMPDIDGTAEESDWEVIEGDADELATDLVAWAGSVVDQVRVRPKLPEVVRGRARERWAPLKRVAVAAGGRWPDVVDQLAIADVERIEQEKEEGITVERPHIVLLRHLHEVIGDESFMATEEIVTQLIRRWPVMWGHESTFGRPLTVQRLGRMVATHYKVNTVKHHSGSRPRGYNRASLEPAFVRFGLDRSNKPDRPVEPVEPDETPERCTKSASHPSGPDDLIAGLEQVEAWNAAVDRMAAEAAEDGEQS